jgi:hypothetical protein
MRMLHRPLSSRFLTLQVVLLLSSAAGVACEDDPDDLDYLRAGTGGHTQASGGGAGATAGAGGSAGEGEADAG